MIHTHVCSTCDEPVTVRCDCPDPVDGPKGFKCWDCLHMEWLLKSFFLGEWHEEIARQVQGYAQKAPTPRHPAN